MLDVVRVQPLKNALYLVLLALGDGVGVHIGEHEAVEVVEGTLHGGGEARRPVGAAADEVGNKGVDALAVALPALAADTLRHSLLGQQPGADGVVQIVVYVGNAVAQAHHGGLAGVVRGAVGVVQDAHAGLLAEIQAPAVTLKHVHDAQALLIVLEASGVNVVERAFPGVTEGRVPQVVPQGDGLGEILVETQGPRHRAGQTADLERVGQARAVVVALGLQEHLRFMLEAAEGLGVGDAVNVPLKAGADLARLLRVQPPAAVLSQYAVRPDDEVLQLFAFFSWTTHVSAPPFFDCFRGAGAVSPFYTAA